jgi:hypothetical protein
MRAARFFGGAPGAQPLDAYDEPVGRGRLALLFTIGALVGGIGLLAWVSTHASTPKDRLQAASEKLARVRVSAAVVDRSLSATEAIADFGVEEGVRLVRVRIVDGLRMDLRIETPDTIELAEPPRVCLVWHFSAPDDAGLSDRCWGEPDLGGLVAARLARSEAGHPVLVAGEAVEIVADLWRGEVRCDYPPGDWQLEMALVPLIDGAPRGTVNLPPVALAVPASGDDPLAFLRFDTRFCGLANSVYRDQGEPQVVAP